MASYKALQPISDNSIKKYLDEIKGRFRRAAEVEYWSFID